MKKKALALAIAGVLATPAALAARDPEGMSYTSSSEGLSGNAEVRWNSRAQGVGASNDANDGGFHYRGDFSVSGNVEIQPGLTGLYNLGIRDNYDYDPSVAVGMRGSFGEIRFGDSDSARDLIVNSTDIANSYSAEWVGDFGGDDYSLLYRSPNLNGFEMHVELQSLNGNNDNITNPYRDGSATVAAGSRPGTGAALATASAVTPATISDSETLDYWAVVGKYSVAGFHVSAGYAVHTDGLAPYSADVVITGEKAANAAAAATSLTNVAAKSRDDKAGWLVGAGYGQDNWNVAGYYGEVQNQGVAITHATATTGTAGVTAANAGSVTYLNTDSEYLSLAGDVTVDRVKFYLIHDRRDNVGGNSAVEQSYTTFGVQYNLSAQTRAWLEYLSRDDNSVSTEKDQIQVALKYYF